MIAILGVMVYYLLFGDIGVKEIKEDIKRLIVHRERIEKEVEYNDKKDNILRKMALDRMEKNKRKGTPGEVKVSGQGTGPVTSGKEYIPYNLSERDKTILRMFNGENR